MDSPQLGLIILAAGASTRLGTPKQLLHYQGRSFIRHTVEVAMASVCQPLAVVLGAYAEQIQPEVNELPVQIVENQQWAEGMSSSIRVGLGALNAIRQHLEAVVIVLCDQPLISSRVINQLVEAYRFAGQPIIASEYAETLGVPALFSRDVFPELMGLKSTQGAKHIIKQHIREVYPLPFPEGAIDVDTLHDYEQLQAMTSKSS